MLLWRIHRLHREKCGCIADLVEGAGCDGADRRSLTALQGAREQIKLDIADVASELVDLTAKEIREKLAGVVDDAISRLYGHEERALQRLGNKAWVEPLARRLRLSRLSAGSHRPLSQVYSRLFGRPLQFAGPRLNQR
jgi:hypothetical protein